MKKTFKISVIVFVLVCLLAAAINWSSNCRKSGRCILLQQETTVDIDKPKAAVEPAAEIIAAAPAVFSAKDGERKTVSLGSSDKESGYKFVAELSSKGAAVEKVTLSEFDNLDKKNPQKLTIVKPVGDEILSLANREFIFVKEKLQLPLENLNWRYLTTKTDDSGVQQVSFDAVILESNSPVIRIIKTYSLKPNSYELECGIAIQNLAAKEQQVRFNLSGPCGIPRDDTRSDTRTVVTGFRAANGQVESKRQVITKFDYKKTSEEVDLAKGATRFLWAAITDKYFASIFVPQSDPNNAVADWVVGKYGLFINPDGDKKGDDEQIGLRIQTAPVTLKPAGIKEFRFSLYCGPKDKTVFDSNDNYKDLGFVQTIDFMACCCPAAMINPIAFGILWSMKWMYGYIHNYGIVIIILVFIIRLLLHPITKKSQVSMYKFGKLAPKMEEIKKKYADNKVELNKQIMALYKEGGASPIMGVLPMMLQMPIWIALYGAIYASVDLRGAQFLPFWITDLSAPDALFKFPVIDLWLLGKHDSFNLLPLLMGVAFYLQQKLTPQQPSTNPQMAQQQKMMMFMMPFLFPIMLYTAPSGLNLYIMASTFAGVIEQYVIKKHLKERDEEQGHGLVEVTSKTGGKVKKKKPKPFFKNM